MKRNLTEGYMSAIGGVIDFKRKEVDFATVNAMRSALSLRGREKSSAYFDNGLGVFYNCDGVYEGNGSDQPLLSERKGKASSLLADCNGINAKGIMEKYRTDGVECLGKLSEPFAIAIYDAERNMLLLARDKKGKKPLFYTAKKGRISFSSEAKGLLAIENNGINVNRDLLSYHLTSVSGVYKASDIYSDISEIAAGECILFTEMGISKFFYREEDISKKYRHYLNDNNIEETVEPYYGVTKSSLSNILSDSLVAFDIPQFDVLSPSIYEIFSSMRKNQKKIFSFYDRLKYKSVSYSYDRADRFSSFFGVSGNSIMPKNGHKLLEDCEIESFKLYSYLVEHFSQTDSENMSLIRRIFGDAKMNHIMRTVASGKIKKEDTEISIRILGMLCQISEWNTLYKLNIKSFEERIYSFSDRMYRY